MKKLLNEVSRLQKLAGILKENSMSDYSSGWETARSQRTNAANYEQDSFEYKCDGDALRIRLDMSGIEKVITITPDGDFYSANLGKVEKSGSEIYLKVGLNDLNITKLIQKCFGNISEEDKKKGDRLKEDGYDEDLDNTKVTIRKGSKYGGTNLNKPVTGIIVGGAGREIDVRIDGSNKQVTVDIGDLDFFTDEPTDYAKKRKSDDEAYFGTNKGLDEKEKPGLWANIRAQRARGEKPARKGSKEYNKAVKAAKEINKGK